MYFFEQYSDKVEQRHYCRTLPIDNFKDDSYETYNSALEILVDLYEGRVSEFRGRRRKLPINSI